MISKSAPLSDNGIFLFYKLYCCNMVQLLFEFKTYLNIDVFDRSMRLYDESAYESEKHLDFWEFWCSLLISFRICYLCTLIILTRCKLYWFIPGVVLFSSLHTIDKYSNITSSYDPGFNEAFANEIFKSAEIELGNRFFHPE